MRTPDELRGLVESYIDELALTPELDRLGDAVRYALEGGGKRIRPILCLATAEAAGAEPERLLPAATAVELVHTFGMVHDDLPALDDDAVRRGRPTVHAQFDEATAILAGDALFAEAVRLALSYPTTNVAREVVGAALEMIGGQVLDLAQDPDFEAIHRLKTGALFRAAVGSALWVAEMPEREQRPWREFADEVGLLYQVVDDILDQDGVVLRRGVEGARQLADETAARAQERLAAVNADTSVLAELVAGLATRTS
jgi:geranylgeranyl diphosphate synthase, type II